MVDQAMLGAGLLGTHVAEGADNFTGGGDLPLLGLKASPKSVIHSGRGRQASDCRLGHAMHDASLVGMFERLRGRATQVGDAAEKN